MSPHYFTMCASAPRIELCVALPCPSSGRTSRWLAPCHLRESALDAAARAVRVRHTGVSLKAEMLDDDLPELSLREGKGLDHRDCEEHEPFPFAEPLHQPHVPCACGASICS